MPFFQPKAQPGRKRKTGAYPTLSLPSLEALLRQQANDGSPLQAPQEASPHTPAMGRRSQKTAAVEHRDIGTMFQRPMQPQPTPAEPARQVTGTRPEAHSNPIEQARAERPADTYLQPSDAPTDTTPTTRQDLKVLLMDFHKILAAELAPIKTNMKAITDRVQASERDIADVQTEGPSNCLGTTSTVTQVITPKVGDTTNALPPITGSNSIPPHSHTRQPPNNSRIHHPPPAAPMVRSHYKRNKAYLTHPTPPRDPNNTACMPCTEEATYHATLPAHRLNEQAIGPSTSNHSTPTLTHRSASTYHTQPPQNRGMTR
ncbi:Hypothetical predicted protein [Pelobates cultripes]|uniref:Uncharacterized protein n=1 Tax=Pelobates cultripes TaxID=61616 RepID=A0AAD1QZD8_PELCU|nr:Hypothetical predicted protein [Pelobates cultripes]